MTKYSYVKAPRWKGHAMEIGPLARMVMAYAMGYKDVKELVDGALKEAGIAAAGTLFDARPHGGTRARGAMGRRPLLEEAMS